MVATDRLEAHKAANALRAAALVALLVLLAGASAWIFAGPWGALWGGVGALTAMAFASHDGGRGVLRRQGARPLTAYDAPWLVDAVTELSRRAGLRHPPALYYVPSPALNAFTVGHADDAAIAVTDGLLRTMEPRQLVGILAHEIAHVRHGDARWAQLAAGLTAITRAMSQAGLLLVMLSVPMALAGAQTPPLSGVLLLLVAPVAAALLQLALARTRELQADLTAAALTGDPLGLASALDRLERTSMGLFGRLFGPRASAAEAPEWLRTHPATRTRIARLVALAEQPTPPPPTPLPAPWLAR